MQTSEVLIIGGGPAGASCAWQLQRQGMGCLILEKESFPRTKLCAGWITPQVVSELEMDIASYPHRFLTFEQLHFHFPLFNFKVDTTQHSIRRYEFDHWLQQRCGAQVIQHDVRNIEYRNGMYIVDGQFKAKYLVGAGGTRCPVFRELFKDINPRAKDLQAVTLEEEFAYDYSDEQCHLWFFDNALPGYSWYVPKQNGYINVGIGAMKERLKQHGQDIHSQWKYFCEQLAEKGLVRDHTFQQKGYSYYVRGGVEQVRRNNAFIVGDAVGLATRDMCEGIGPAIQSGMLAANSILHNSEYDLHAIAAYSGESFLARKLIEYKFHAVLPWQTAA